MKRSLMVFAAALAALTQGSCKHTPPPNVAADVNGYAITYTELDKVFQQTQQPGEQANEDQIAGAKLELLNTMITSRIVLQRAERLGLTAVDADVDAEFNKMKAPYTKEQFEARLVEKHMTADDLKTQIRHDLTINKLINKEITSHVSITDADVANFFAANKAAFNHPEPTIRIAQILVTPNPDPNVRNLKNSKAQNEKQAKEKIEDIAARLQRGEDFGMLAQNYSEDPNSAANGGDMGPIPVSNLDKVSPELRKLVLSLQPGVVSPPIPTQYGFQILKVISREPAGQRELNDPRVQNEIRDTLINRKTNLLQAAFYEVARNESKVQNYLAQRIVQSASK
ncbi:MAG TPA: peptidylprolyl isomerase [Bryobacteraceae bacterium]|nr:peptidylprolyl isomerase [Bryobacteraceae bacterium]